MFKVILRAKAAASGCRKQKATALDQGGMEDTLATGRKVPGMPITLVP